ncbi:MAG: Response regulator receiver protein [Chthoniobacteraceae bacterium]|nr:Response regulator receiver protein [Chthoniobacteraceae bacterium]
MNTLNSKGKILIGEEVRVTAARMLEALRREDYIVEVATGSDEFIAKTRELVPDLAIIDFVMPQLQGLNVLKLLQKEVHCSKTGVILCLPRDLQLNQSTLTELGRVDLLLRPFDMRQLVEKVDSFFTRRRRAAAFGTVQEESTVVTEAYKPRLDVDSGRFSLWGTRGSTPTPGARFLRHGGNTSCLSVTYGQDKFIFDAGSGIRDLGLALLNQATRNLHLFITHTHWDHIQGFPFFAPAYAPGFEISIYGAEKFGKDLKSIFRGQLDREYFPVQMDDLNSSIRFRHLDENPIVVGDVKIWWEFAQHPGATVGYKIEAGGYTIAWVPDNEFMMGYTGSPIGITIDHPMVCPYRSMIDFLTGVDVLIHEAQYTNDEYPDKIGWGHSSVSNICLLAKFAGVRRWIITHHDPMHDDAFLESKLNMTRHILALIDHPCLVSHGYDGQTEHF